MDVNVILQGNCLDVLRTLPDQFVQCCVTSPPYWGLRDYGVAGQLGLEKTPEAYVEKLVAVFREVKRVLRNDGTLWLNLGDSYYNYRPGAGQKLVKQTVSNNNQDLPVICSRRANRQSGLKEKDIIGIPWRVAFALQADGWYLRQDIIWSKPNPMPESVTDRCTKAHEYIFLLTKSARYFYNNEAIKEETTTFDFTNRDRDLTRLNNTPGRTRMAGLKTNQYEMRNRRSVWTITTKSFKEAHFATFPPKIPEICIRAGSKVGDTILDSFMGAGTTGMVAKILNRNYIGVELNPKYIQMAENRIRKTIVQQEMELYG
jgi:DNA modification methylase